MIIGMFKCSKYYAVIRIIHKDKGLARRGMNRKYLKRNKIKGRKSFLYPNKISLRWSAKVAKIGLNG